MRMRRKPWARPELESCKFFIQKPSEYKGRWREFFGNDKPMYMELGCGKGTFMAVHGSKNPDINYITVDIKDEVLVLAKRNIEEAYKKVGHEIDNVALMSQEILLIDDMLDENDVIERIYINFCNVIHKYIMDNTTKNYYKIINYLALFPATSSWMLFGTSS